jgi:hypothetical protein
MRGILATVLFVASQSAWCGTEREAFGVVLADLATRTDLHSTRNDGVILIRPTTQAWSTDALRVFNLLDRPGTCGVSGDMYQALASANAVPTDVGKSLPDSTHWRVLSPADLPTRSLIPDKTISGEAIKTTAHLSNPGLIAGTDTALLLVSFTWSMHAGIAQYVLRHGPVGWQIKCSELIFYP